MADNEDKKMLMSRGYKVKQYERVKPQRPPDTPGNFNLVWPKLLDDETIAPAADGSDYDSFPAVFDPNGSAVCPYNSKGEPMPIDEQWERARIQFHVRNSKSRKV